MNSQTNIVVAEPLPFSANQSGRELPAAPKRPLLVWVIGLWLIAGGVLSLYSFHAIHSGRIALPPEYARVTHRGHVVLQHLALIAVTLWAGMALLGLRRVVFTLLATLTGMSAIWTLALLAPGNTLSEGNARMMIMHETVSIVLCAAMSFYAWRLKQSGVLR